MRAHFDPDAAPLNISLSQGLGLSKTTICLDPRTLTMRVERKVFGISKASLELPFRDFSRLETWEVPGESSTTHLIRVELRSGERHFINGGDKEKTAAAVAAITSFLELTKEDAVLTERSKQNRRKDLFWLLAALTIAAFPLIESVRSYFVLPACDEKSIEETLTSILTKHAKGAAVDLSDFQAVDDANDLRTCRATWTVAGDEVTVDYKIVWDGWTPRVEASWRR